MDSRNLQDLPYNKVADETLQYQSDVQRLQRWPNIEPKVGNHLVFLPGTVCMPFPLVHSLVSQTCLKLFTFVCNELTASPSHGS